MDVTMQPIKNITQEEGINTVCTAYENVYKDRPPIHTCAYKRKPQ